MKKTLVFIFLLCTKFGAAQLIEMRPSFTTKMEWSLEAEKAFKDNEDAYRKILTKIENGTKPEELSPKEKAFYDSFDETIEDYWDIIGGGCSWYCGGGPKEVTASSTLATVDEITYEANNAHDLSYKSAWVEGVEGYGIGEYLTYTFSPEAPRVTSIIIVNGYVKSQAAWENNSRVKKLKVYLNDKPYAIFHLEDIRGEQHFSVPAIGNEDRGNWEELQKMPNWTLKFEILEVYKGLKYDDVAISEIYFDGIDVHCLAKGTPVLMGDNSLKNIEDLRLGDSILYYDFETKTTKIACVEQVEAAIHQNLVTYTFKSGLQISSTQDHPFWIEGKGWASLNPGKSSQYLGFDGIQKIEVGDLFASTDSMDTLIAIDYLQEAQITYTISRLSEGNNFIANGKIVGVERLEIKQAQKNQRKD